MQGSRGQSPFLGRAARNGLPKRSDAQRREFPGAGIRTEAPGGKSCTSLQRTSRAARRPRRVRGGPELSVAPIPQASADLAAPGEQGLP